MNKLTTPAPSGFVKVHRAKPAVQKITLPIMNRYVVVPVTEVLYIQSDVNYCFVYLKDGRRFLIAKTLKEYNDQLDSSLFARVHKSYLVNLSAVEYCDYAGYEIQLSNGLSLPIARRKRKLFYQQFNLFDKHQRLAS
ncbi:LytR/AlgR family response regulator transcription factor [Runella sp.]|uniref:LytR/AlgR family response regulator transcription factor n=1 Tax=Runella sp. TaxID=1960881 RepID=UPI003D10DE57